MAAKSLTDVEVRSLRALSDQRLEIFDAKARDLCLRVTPKQKVIEFRLRGQRQAQAAPPYDRRLSGLDAFRSAREGFGAAQTGQDGGDPIMETKTRRDALTVAGLIERFIDRYAKATPRSWRDSDAVLKFDCILGAPGRATTYKWKNDCLNQILNIELDQRIIEKEEEKNNKETERTDDIEVSRKRSTKVIATAKKRNCCSDHKGLNRSSAVAGASAKNTHYNSAEKAQHNAHQCVENSAHFAEKTEHLHTHSSLKDSLPNEGSVSTH